MCRYHSGNTSGECRICPEHLSLFDMTKLLGHFSKAFCTRCLYQHLAVHSVELQAGMMMTGRARCTVSNAVRWDQMHARANPHESHQHHMTDGQHTQVLCHVNSCDNVQPRGHSTGAQHWLSERTMTAMAQRTQTLDVPWHTVEEQVARHTRCCKHDQRAADKARTCCAAAGRCPRPRKQDSILTVKAEFCAARGVGWEAVSLNSPPSCTCLPRSAHPRQKAVVPRISLVQFV